MSDNQVSIPEYQIGQIFENEYPAQVASFCSKNNCKIEVIETVDKYVKGFVYADRQGFIYPDIENADGTKKKNPKNKYVFCLFTDKTYVITWPYNYKKFETALENGTPVQMKRYQIVEIPAPTTEEVASQIRAQRDAMIAETDYLMMSDYPISEEDKALVETYRQALRDIPEQEGFPSEVQWPVAPQCLK